MSGSSVSVLLFTTLLLTGCAGGLAAKRSETGPAAEPTTRVVAAIRSAPPTMVDYLQSAGSFSGASHMVRLASSGLSWTNDHGVRVPQLAEAVPTAENGLWNVLPDGRMETTWTVRSGARWHDGTPVTSADLAFTALVQQDPDLREFGSDVYSFVEAIETPDQRTVRARWKQAYVDADGLFSNILLPAHLLDSPYRERKEAFTQLPYWHTGFIGNGPFQVREFVHGQYVVLDAFDAYVLGRPKIDTIEVRFIGDVNTLSANILAGEVQLTMGLKNFSGEEAANLAEQWKDGSVAVPAITTVTASPQFVNPNPPILAHLQFRRALVHALNREELAALPGGLMVPHGLLDPLVPEYEPSRPAIVHYDYDLRRSAQLLEELGYSKDAEGFYRDSSGNKPVIEARTNTTAANQRVALFASDQWNRAGIASQLNVFSTAQSTNLEFRRTFPAFEILGSTGGRKIDRYLSCGAGLPSNNYAGTCGGNNRSNYMNPKLDELITRFSTTIPWEPRMEAFNAALHLVTDEVVVVGMAFTSDGNMVSNRLENVSQTVWNADQWGLR